MKKVILAALVGLTFSSAAFSKVDMNPDAGFGKPHPENVYIAKDGSTVVLHKQGVVQVVDKEGNSTFHVAEKSQAFRDIDGKVVHIDGAGHHYADIKAGLDKFIAESQNGSNNGQGGEDIPARPQPEMGVERPHPGNGIGSVERPQPGNGEGSVERPQPGNGEGGVERPRPGQGEGSVSRPQPGTENRPTNPQLNQAITNNANNIAAMGEAFEQRVDAVNGYLSQAGQAIQNNSNKIDALGAAFQAQAAHTASEITRLDGRIDSLEKKTDKLKAGVAGATAIASLTQYVGSGSHHVAVGIGGYDGASALAGGYTYVISANTTIRATIALDSEDEVAFGASVGHSW